jgi:type I restriction enzyme S subunit
MKDIELPVPPTLDEQIVIVNSLDSQCSAFSTAIARLSREIELLREYRTRLVADVVTGKLDVRAAAKELPEEGACRSDESDESDRSDVSDDLEPEVEP